jgi:UPF0176 protein
LSVLYETVYIRSQNYTNKMTDNTYHIRAFYRFVDLPNYEKLKKPFDQFCKAHDMKGTILIASEGVNATVSAPKEVMEKFFYFLDQDHRFADMPYKESFADFHPFERMKVRLKKEIVRLAVDELDVSERGEYVRGEEWDKLISDPEVITIDTRNDYEVMMGTFEGAVDPKTDDFRSFPQWAAENLDPAKHKKVAMFCTGGIRCEKSTAYLKQQGFENVYHLEGGILQYLEDTQNKNGKWKGDCFVFDDRIAVNDHLEPVKGTILCKKCSCPLDLTTDDFMHAEEGSRLKNVNHKGITCEALGIECLDNQ